MKKLWFAPHNYWGLHEGDLIQITHGNTTLECRVRDGGLWVYAPPGVDGYAFLCCLSALLDYGAMARVGVSFCLYRDDPRFAEVSRWLEELTDAYVEDESEDFILYTVPCDLWSTDYGE